MYFTTLYYRYQILFYNIIKKIKKTFPGRNRLKELFVKNRTFSDSENITEPKSGNENPLPA
jgi:hypothetical protein